MVKAHLSFIKSFLHSLPPPFQPDPSNPSTCVRCPQRCPKKCKGVLIDFVTAASTLNGCTIIEGNLVIKVITDLPNVERDLEHYLGDIEEIEGFLKIVRSNAITSLNFLRSLKVIRGRKLESDRYAFLLFENHNLKRMMDFSNRDPLQITNGSMSIYYNNKLCQTELDSFRSHTNVGDHPKNNIPPTNTASSGHCEFQTITSDYQILSAYNVTVYWKPFTPQNRSVTVEGYTLYYMETTRDNLNWFNGRESCSTYSWKTKTLDSEAGLQFDKKRKMHYLVLNGLKQVTKYAFYIRSLQSVMNTLSGQSNVKYFTTPLDTLTPPVVTTLLKGETSITLNWRIPVKERQFINFFHVDILVVPENAEILAMRDYCKHPVINDPVQEIRTRNRELREEMEECNCDESLLEDEFLNIQMELYDSLKKINYANKVHDCDEEPTHSLCESYENKKFKRDLFEFQKKFVLKENHTIDKRDISLAENYVNSYRIEKHVDNFTISQLQPFTNYAFEFFSCHNNRECSSYFFHVERTSPNLTGDALRDEDLKLISDERKIVKLEFREPSHSNGATLGFKVEQRIPGSSSSSVTLVSCITRIEHQRNNYSFVVDNLPPNIYEFRVKSFSLALEGPWTDWKAVTLKEEAPSQSFHFNFIGTLVVIFIVCLVVSCGIYSYRNFKCLSRGDDTIYLMSELERDLEVDKEELDFFPIDFSRNRQNSSSSSSRYRD